MLTDRFARAVDDARVARATQARNSSSLRFR